MNQTIWIWIARTLRDLSVWAYGHTWHELYYSEQCHGDCNITHARAETYATAMVYEKNHYTHGGE